MDFNAGFAMLIMNIQLLNMYGRAAAAGVSFVVHWMHFL